MDYELLVRTREELLARGHTQRGSYVDHEGRVCIMGAMLYAAGLDPSRRDGKAFHELISSPDATRLLHDAARTLGFSNPQAAYTWNDMASVELVLYLLDTVIEANAPAAPETTDRELVLA